VGTARFTQTFVSTRMLTAAGVSIQILLCGSTGQNLAFATARIPGGDDWIDRIHSHRAEGIKTAWVDRSWPPRNFGEHPPGTRLPSCANRSR
jgi:hypothetical protein